MDLVEVGSQRGLVRPLRPLHQSRRRFEHPTIVVYTCREGRGAIGVAGIFLSWEGIAEGYRASRWVPDQADTRGCVCLVSEWDMLPMC